MNKSLISTDSNETINIYKERLVQMNQRMTPLNKALIRFELQKPSSKKALKKPRRDQDQINIDGKNYVWGQFKKKWLKETEVKGSANHKWLINKGNEQNEKFLYWDKRSGFRSDDSDD